MNGSELVVVSGPSFRSWLERYMYDVARRMRGESACIEACTFARANEHDL